MPAKKKKRKYTFRKGQIVPYESGSLMHEAVKAERELKKDLGRALGYKKRRKSERESNALAKSLIGRLPDLLMAELRSALSRDISPNFSVFCIT